MYFRYICNFPLQAQAEEGFIGACQSLSGYGQESFAAREQSRQVEVDIAISLTGITVTSDNSEISKFYKYISEKCHESDLTTVSNNRIFLSFRWTDIKNVINHKRNFSIECQNVSDSSSFSFSSAEDGKYVWRMCVLQHTFFMKHQLAVLVPGEQNQTLNNLPQPKFQVFNLILLDFHFYKRHSKFFPPFFRTTEYPIVAMI